MPALILGFTGTRDGMTEAQELMVWECLKRWRPELLRHGDCEGADEQCHNLARREGVYVVLHPPLNETYRAFCQNADEIWPAKDYLTRDRDIVDHSGVLLAAPKSAVDVGWSGTWYTIRYARRRHHPVVIVGPDGRIVETTNAHGGRLEDR